MQAVANDDVIADGDAEELAGADESTRELDVVDAGRRVTTRVIVRNDDGGGVGQDGDLEDFARMDDRRVELAAADFVVRDDAVLRGETEHAEDFRRFVLQDRGQQRCRVARRAERGTERQGCPSWSRRTE
jgi:hypothetical protein